MRVLIINSVCGIRSTGRICTDIADKMSKEGHEVKIAYGREAYVPEQYQKYAVRIGNDWDVRFHALKARLFDASGFGSKKATKQFLKWADEYNPDLLWLHNIHGYYINIEQLFNWIKSRPEMQVKWTLHDCWAFTGHCTHFTYVGCEKWKKQCKDCPQFKEYPKSLFVDNSYNNFNKKKQLFTNIENLELISPSKWLEDIVRHSYLCDYKIRTIHNNIDKSVFKPTSSDFRERYKLDNKKVILGVSNIWNEKKGLSDFIKLSKLIDERYIIVLVGLTKKQIEHMPNNIIGIEYTNNCKTLAEIYTAADLFFNPSREETFSMTTLEAITCGTNALVYRKLFEVDKDTQQLYVCDADVNEAYKYIMKLTS